MADSGKSDSAFRTIGELSTELGVPQHILRYWETRFPQLRPLTRAGNRRYYRPEDVALVRRISTALGRDGYTIKGVQKLLSGKDVATDPLPVSAAASVGTGSLLAELTRIRRALAAALDG
ncbi:MerR family transcriptional regulator [Sphingomonas sp. SUN039]|uniref:MerR family transcriptional regulator n=1 Tax=Sphingomonas sp. SUN039 TaxID=2937787 RepID=UPI0021646A5C|nr:MerR family transcriptional regulator [Sphingomonas sp. SUN039]UVO55407.1 MerR family transcriptional regulator [Sphingomonas sp. SUN039]